MTSRQWGLLLIVVVLFVVALIPACLRGGSRVLRRPRPVPGPRYDTSIRNALVTGQESNRNCFQVVMRLTGISDVAAVGLTVQVLATGMNDAPIDDATITASASLTCGVVSTHHRTLVGSLRGLGSRPIPWK